MNILHLGASGRLGSAIERLYPQHTFYSPTAHELDITNEQHVHTYVTNIPNIDAVINCAAYNNVDGAEGEGRTLAKQINGEAPLYLARAASERNIPLIQFSTDYVFSGTIGRPYVESDAPDPISVYGESKALGEAQAQAAHPSGTYIVRTSRLFGPKGRAEDSKKSFVELVLHLAKTESYFSMNPFEVGSPTHVDDLATHVMEQILLQSTRPEPGIYHATNSGWCTFYEWAHAILAASGSSSIVFPRDPRKEPDTRPAKRPECSILHSTKLPPMREWYTALTHDLKHL